MKKRIDILPVFMVFYVFVELVLLPLTVTGQESSVPKLINYQGFLTDKDGKALTGHYKITFQLYDDASAANPALWKETHDSVKVENGQFNVLLGSVKTLSADNFDGDRYLGIQMAGESEMKPLMQLVSVAYSLKSDQTRNFEPHFDSDWFNVEKSKEYSFSHNLGVIPRQVQMFYSENANGSPAYIVNIFNTNWSDGYQVELTESNAKVMTGNGYVCLTKVNVGENTGYYRLFLWK